MSDTLVVGCLATLVMAGALALQPDGEEDLIRRRFAAATGCSFARTTVERRPGRPYCVSGCGRDADVEFWLVAPGDPPRYHWYMAPRPAGDRCAAR